MYNINRAITDGDYTREQAVSGTNATVTEALSLYNRNGQIG